MSGIFVLFQDLLEVVVKVIKKFCVFIIGFFCLFHIAHADQPDRLAELKGLHGCWAVTSMEINTVGEVIRQTGNIKVTANPDGTDVKIEHSYNVLESTGAYSGIPRTQQLTEVITFDDKTGLALKSTTRPRSSTATKRNMALSADGKSLFNTFMFYNARRGITLFGESRLKIVSDDEVSNNSEIYDVFGDYSELYVENWHRKLDKSEANCL